jgi:hypothetical protein
VRGAAEAFDEKDELRDERAARAMKGLVQRLVEMARLMA